MTVTIELAPHVQRRLESKARRDGRTLAEYLGRVAERDALALEPIEQAATQLTDEQKAEIARKLALMDEFVGTAREYSQNAPLLSDFALSRAGAYEEPQQ